MIHGSRRFRLSLGGAALLASFGCLHCGDDDGDATPQAEAGETSTAGASADPIGGAPSDAGRGGGGAEPAPGGAAGAAGSSGGVGGEPAIVPEGEHYGFVFDSISTPTNNAQARDDGFDLNGDDVVDNQLGMVFATLSTQGFDDNGPLNGLVQEGEIIMLANLQTTSFSSAPAVGFDTYYGTNPSPEPCSAVDDCGHHLDGTGSFDLTDDELDGETCTGTIAEGTFSGSGGRLPVRVVFGGAPIDFTLEDARVELSGLSEDGFSEGRIGGVISAENIDTQLYPSMHANLQVSIAADCTGAPPPSCGCTPSSTGAAVLNLYDLDRDCTLTLEEVKENSLIMSLLAPDLDRDNDGTGDGLSFGFSFSGKHATFDLP